MFGGWKIAGAIGIALIMMFGVYKYQEYRFDQKIEQLEVENDQLKENNVKLEGANETNQNTIDRLEEERERNQQFVNELNEALESSEEPARELRRLFNRHNLENLAYERPGLIEKRINDGTKETFDRIRRNTIP